jgi:WD40 repeat protein
MSNLNQSWECVAELVGHSSWIYGVPITSQGILASVSGHEIILWNLETREIDSILDGHTKTIFALDCSPDSKFLASGGHDKTTVLWSLETKEAVCILAPRKDVIYSVAFSPDSKMLACGGENKYKTADGQKTTIYLWDIGTQQLIKTLSGHDLRVNSLAFSPDGKTLASISNDLTTRVWNVESGMQTQVFTGQAATVAFTHDGENLLTSGEGGIKVWDFLKGELIYTFAPEAEYVRCFAIHPTGQFLAFESHEGIEVWDLTKKQRVQYFSFQWPTSISFSPDGNLLASGDATAFTDAGGIVKVWRVPESDIEHFDPKKIKDERKKTIRAITQRRGQVKFRKKLLSAYNYHCCITGCDVEAALQAAHIVPYRGTHTNHVTNGLLLRADIHTLFDLYLLSINPDTLTVEVAPQLDKTQYDQFNNKLMYEPTSKSDRPSSEGLRWHYEEFKSKIDAK